MGANNTPFQEAHLRNGHSITLISGLPLTPITRTCPTFLVDKIIKPLQKPELFGINYVHIRNPVATNF